MKPRDKRALGICTLGVMILLVYHGGLKSWLDRWQDVRSDIRFHRARLQQLDGGPAAAARQANLLKKVPMMEMPQPESAQRLRCKAKFIEQLEKNKIAFKSVNYIKKSKSAKNDGYQMLFLQCRAKCKFDQLTDLLAALYQNPFIVGVEELRLQCDSKKREEMDLTLTVSTYALKTKG